MTQVSDEELKKVQPQLDWFPRRLKELRENAGFTQSQVGNAMGISFKRIWDVEAGRNDLKVSTVCRILLAMGVTWDKFIEGMPRTFDYRRAPEAAKKEEFGFITKMLSSISLDPAQWKEIESIAKAKRKG